MSSGVITLNGAGDSKTVETFSKQTPGVAYWYVDISNIGQDGEVEVREEVNINETGYQTHIKFTYDVTDSQPIISQSNNLMVYSDVKARVVIEQVNGSGFDVPYATGVKF